MISQEYNEHHAVANDNDINTTTIVRDTNYVTTDNNLNNDTLIELKTN